jgi:glycosyltransferase involved in cell wall biosynthesis
MKSIWIISQNSGTPKIGGVQRHFFLSKIFNKKGYNTTIIVNAQNHLFNKSIKKGTQKLDGSYFYLIKTLFKFSNGVFRFAQMIEFGLKCFFLPFSRLNKPEIIILSSMSLFPLPAVLFLKFWYNAKFIFEVRDLWPLTPIKMKKISKWNPMILLISYLEKVGYRKADKIVTTLQDSETYINLITNQPKKVEFISNGVPISWITQKKFNEKKNIISNTISITYGGSFGIANALDPLVCLLEEQKDLSKKIIFNFIGSGYLKEKFRLRLSKFDNIHFHEKLNRKSFIRELIKSDLAFISWMDLPELYRYGVSAQKYYDYMASGIPILSAQTGINDPVKQAGCGIIVQNNTEGIRTGINKFLMLSEKERNDMGERGRNFVKSFTYEKMAEKYIQIFQHGLI